MSFSSSRQCLAQPTDMNGVRRRISCNTSFQTSFPGRADSFLPLLHEGEGRDLPFPWMLQAHPSAQGTSSCPTLLPQSQEELLAPDRANTSGSTNSHLHC